MPIDFGNDTDAIAAARNGVALCDRTHWGRLQLSGADRQTFLHNQSTNDLKTLQPGQGCDTVFVTPTARTIDLATAYVLEDAVLLVVSPNRRNHLLKWLDRYIFFGDKVELKDLTEETALFSLIGAQSSALLKKLGVNAMESQPYASHCLVEIANQPVRVAVGTGLVAREAARITGRASDVTGVDVSRGMLERARAACGIGLIQARAEALPVRDAGVDMVTMGYALRHVADLLDAFREYHRVLRPGGSVLLLEIGRPRGRWAYGVARFYLGRVIPVLCRLALPGREASTLMGYHWDTIETCVPPEAILDGLREAGFVGVECEVVLGIFRAYRARRPGG